MAKVKNESGTAVSVPALNRSVLAGQVIEVTDEQVYGLTCSSNWSPADRAAEAAHKAGEKAYAAAVAAEERSRQGLPEPAEDVADGDESEGK